VNDIVFNEGVVIGVPRPLSMKMKIRCPKIPDEINEVWRLFQEYEAFLGVDLCFQSFHEKLADLPGKYAAPEGVLFIALQEEDVAGCVAVRKLEETVCEMKRQNLKIKMVWLKVKFAIFLPVLQAIWLTKKGER
jgi:hypothetical protein